ncbi:MAG: ferrous iron transport protein A [Bacteroidetes bacterium]|nr:ferrous iron transport protein A [Bacteroidota bacterium]MCL5739082.1 ferrous iron transport protein A [Bacteroidota bacterium]
MRYRFGHSRGRTPVETDTIKTYPSRTSLKELQVGEAAHIVDFFNPDEIARKIEAMGLRKGKKITVLQKLGRGILIKTNNSRIVITSDVAKNIEVK